jgi:hypothetical protein
VAHIRSGLQSRTLPQVEAGRLDVEREQDRPGAPPSMPPSFAWREPGYQAGNSSVPRAERISRLSEGPNTCGPAGRREPCPMTSGPAPERSARVCAQPIDDRGAFFVVRRIRHCDGGLGEIGHWVSSSIGRGRGWPLQSPPLSCGATLRGRGIPVVARRQGLARCCRLPAGARTGVDASTQNWALHHA